MLCQITHSAVSINKEYFTVSLFSWGTPNKKKTTEHVWFQLPKGIVCFETFLDLLLAQVQENKIIIKVFCLIHTAPGPQLSSKWFFMSTSIIVALFHMLYLKMNFTWENFTCRLNKNGLKSMTQSNQSPGHWFVTGSSVQINDSI